MVIKCLVGFSTLFRQPLKKLKDNIRVDLGILH